MAKEIPYFKFYTGEWFTGDIILEEFELQGLFINICAFYWSKDCELSVPMLLKKFKGYKSHLDQLVSANLIKTDGDNIYISFLDEQFDSKEVQKITNRVNGSKGGRPKKTKEEKPNGFNFGYDLETEAEPKDNPNNNPNETNIKESKVDYSKEDESKEDFAFTEKKTELVHLLAKAFSFDGMHFKTEQSNISSFVHSQIKNESDYEHFTTQYRNYKEYKKIADEIEHNFRSFLGTQQEAFVDSKWNSENWGAKIDQWNLKNKKQTKSEKIKDVFGQALQDLKNGHTAS